MTLNLIETLKASIYSPKLIQNTKIHFMNNINIIIKKIITHFHLFRKSIFSNIRSSNTSTFYNDLHALSKCYSEGHTALLVSFLLWQPFWSKFTKKASNILSKHHAEK